MINFKSLNNKNELTQEKYFSINRPCIINYTDDNSTRYFSGPTKAGDIAYYNGKTIRIVSLSIYQKYIKSDSSCTPIGVVVVPNTHTPDGSSRIMHFKHLSLWGGTNAKSQYGYGIYYATSGCKDILPSGCTLISGVTNTIPYCDEFKQNCGNGYGDNDENLIDRVYLDNGYKNLDTFNDKHNLSSDFNGLENTLALVRASNQDNLNKVISGEEDCSKYFNYANTEKFYTHAILCYLFNTVGTEKHEWYLPSISELLYLSDKLTVINTSLLAVGGYKIRAYPDKNSDGELDRDNPSGDYCWIIDSSTQSSKGHFWRLVFNQPDCNERLCTSYPGQERVWAFRKVF